MSEQWEHRFVETNGVRLHCVVQGQGKLMILLHGFPEFWYSWRHQIPVMAKYFRVVAPDMRGYNESDKPEGVENYRLDILVEDVMGLIKAFGEEKAIIVGHDWGAIVAWAFAMAHPEATERLIIMNVPHPAVWQEKAKYIPEQLQKSWYIFFFQLERVPESYFSRNNYLVMRVCRGVVETRSTNRGHQLLPGEHQTRNLHGGHPARISQDNLPHSRDLGREGPSPHTRSQQRRGEIR
ncbi:MAG: alpha/beta fold hydrolase [Candidatus Freyarchaeota archaeon]